MRVNEDIPAWNHMDDCVYDRFKYRVGLAVEIHTHNNVDRVVVRARGRVIERVEDTVTELINES